MARDTNLTRRGAVYYARIFVPKDLQLVMSGKTEIRPSLKTSDYSEAKRRKSAVVDHWTSILDDLRRRRELTEDDISAAVWEHYNVGLEAGSKARSKRPTPADIEEAFDKATAEAFQSGAHEAAR